MKQAAVFIILLSCFYHDSSANLIKQFKGDSCEDQIFPKPPCCGIGKKSAARIINGTEADVNEFPWLVKLNSCGGSLINSRWVLTAAHCVQLAPPRVAIFGAQNCSNEFCTKYEKQIKIKQKFALKENLHLYVHYWFGDIALLQLEEPVTFSDAIQPICLPTAVNQHLGGRKAVVSGWGATVSNRTNPSPNLLKTTVEIWDPERCDNFDQFGFNLSSKYVICAGGESNSSCGGDSGGPLFLKLNDEQNRAPYYQIGIVSFSHTTCGFEGFPQAYTNVANYMKWIKDTILENQDH